MRILTLLLTLLAAPLLAEQTLVMVEQEGCRHCARWDAEIAPKYDKTPEGKAAPLRRIDLHAPLPEDLHFKSPVIYTPTFILLRDGEEVGRIEGYPGEMFFWPFLARLIERNVDPEGLEISGRTSADAP